MYRRGLLRASQALPVDGRVRRRACRAVGSQARGVPQHRGVAQLVAHPLWERKAAGSNPVTRHAAIRSRHREHHCEEHRRSWPTGFRINVEVPFTELQSDFDRATKELAKQVRLPGFRPGKAPAKLLEARVGRGAVQAGRQRCASGPLQRSGDDHRTQADRPAGDRVTKISDGEELVFTAEVDVRPDIDLPDLSTLEISVEPIGVTDDEVDAELEPCGASAPSRASSARRRPVTSSPSTCRPRSTVRTFPDGRAGACPTRSVRVSSSRASTRRSSELSEGRSTTFSTKLVAGERAGGGRRHRHREVHQERELPRGRRRVRAAGKRNSTPWPSCGRTSSSRSARSSASTRRRRSATTRWRCCWRRWKCRFRRTSSRPRSRPRYCCDPRTRA